MKHLLIIAFVLITSAIYSQKLTGNKDFLKFKLSPTIDTTPATLHITVYDSVGIDSNRIVAKIDPTGNLIVMDSAATIRVLINQILKGHPKFHKLLVRKSQQK